MMSKEEAAEINAEYVRVRDEAIAIRDRAKENGLIDLKRWEDGIPHHPKSEELMRFLALHDFKDMNDHFCWKMGGDGDNGESLMYEMDVFFEQKDIDDK